MEKIQECAGNLLAELYDARFEFKHGRMTQEAFLSRVNVLRGMARSVRQRYCKPRPQVSAVLPGFEGYAEAWKAILDQPRQLEDSHDTGQAAYL